MAVIRKKLDSPTDLHEITESAPYGQVYLATVTVIQKYRREIESALDFLVLTQSICLEGRNEFS